MTSLTVVPDYFKYSDENSVSPYSRGPTEISFRNQKYQIGNYVAVKGLEHEEYYGIIVGFDVGANGSKRFWMRWIAPKEGRLARHKLPDTSFDMNDFTEGI